MVYRMFDCKKETLKKLLENGAVITATDTNVGKTFFSIHCLLSTNGTYWKPIQSGQPSDREQVQRATGLDDSHFIKEKYNLTRPLSPHEAAAHDKQAISLEQFQQMPNILHPPLIIEGSGGVLVPLNKQHPMVDLFCHFRPSCYHRGPIIAGYHQPYLDDTGMFAKQEAAYFGCGNRGLPNCPRMKRRFHFTGK